MCLQNKEKIILQTLPVLEIYVNSVFSIFYWRYLFKGGTVFKKTRQGPSLSR